MFSCSSASSARLCCPLDLRVGDSNQLGMARSVRGGSSDPALTHPHGASTLFCFFFFHEPSKPRVCCLCLFLHPSPHPGVSDTAQALSAASESWQTHNHFWIEKYNTARKRKKKIKNHPWIACKEIKQNAIPPLLLSVLEPSKKFLSSSVRVSFYSSMTNTELASLNI